MNRIVYDHSLLNPFVSLVNEQYVIRETPDKLIIAQKTSPYFSEYKKAATVIEKKCNFAFNSVRNAFKSLSAVSVNHSKPTQNIHFLQENPDQHIELLNPLTCRWQEKIYIFDLRHFQILQLDQNAVETVFEIISMDDRTKTLLQASEYYSTEPKNST